MGLDMGDVRLQQDGWKQGNPLCTNGLNGIWMTLQSLSLSHLVAIRALPSLVHPAIHRVALCRYAPPGYTPIAGL